MSELLKIQSGKCHFLTLTVVNWVDVFTRLCYINIMLESIRYCQQYKGLELYAYVIMPNHIHMIASAERSLSSILCDMKEHVSKQVIFEIMNSKQESRRAWLLKHFEIARSGKKRRYRFWQGGNYPVELFFRKFIIQKERYIHMNPVRTGLVSCPENYRLSSASPESPIDVLPIG